MMVDAFLLEYERDVEQSRARLTRDLAVLCSPETFANFTDDLKQEAFETKDALWDDVKARAAANPAAVIAIGAGLAWRLLQRPPIATALIGLGVYSLWNTEPKQPGDGTPDYLQQSRQALKEQTREALSAASRIAGQAQEAVAAKGAEIWDDAREKVREWGEEVATRLDDTTSRAKSTGQAFLDDVRAKQHDLRGQVEDVAAKAADKFRDEDTRNNLLLGLAGLTIAAALGIACQKKITDTAAV
jgi:hypothetical protein